MIVHNLTHRHARATREGVGEISLCGWRFSRKVRRFAFRPDFDGASWYLIDARTAHQILAHAESAHAAMALVRAL